MEWKDVLAAIEIFETNGPPADYGPPTRYWLVHPDNRKLYPQKTIYGMANNLDQATCPTATITRQRLANLGFEIFDEQRNDPEYQPGIQKP